ncbi:MAG: hypothetical protein JO316_25295 [Abitibacteriaceae bacterium]|nr:hypothetical protein [Abditibacteriaceae bacterium]
MKVYCKKEKALWPKTSWCRTLLLTGSLVVLAPGASHAQDANAKPFLHRLFTDNMVLQRDMPDPIWGWTTPGQKVTVAVRGRSVSTVAGADGKWMTKIGPLPVGGPYTVTVSGPQTATLNNVMSGDVWICSGQSNMEMGIANVNNAQQEIANANYPMIRLYTVPKSIQTEPQPLVNSQWQVCDPQTVANGGWGGFSAVSYFFGRGLYQKLKVPIGLIHTSWGGTVAEAWTSAEALNTMADFKPAVATLQQAAAAAKNGPVDFNKAMADWYQKNDPGSANGLGWAEAALTTTGWKTMNLPQAWEGAGLPDFDGIVWFRKDFDLDDTWNGKDVVLHLGPIDDRDTTWVNGTPVGATDSVQPMRDYKIPANVLHTGHNVIAVRVLDTGGAGGFYGKAGDMRLEATGANAPAPISLAGDWVYQVGVALNKTGPLPQHLNDNPNNVTVLYNGMIAPLIPFAIKGAIWYQGESNGGRGLQYRTLLPTMINDWRSRFGVGQFPFFIVQLANFTDTKPDPEQGDDGWSGVREAQLMTAQTLPKVGVAVTTDIGEAKDIHPKNKQEVGRRLALNALAIAYGQKLEYSGPIYRSMKKDGNTIHLTFDHVDGGLVAQGGNKLEGFSIAGADKKFVWADARIEGNTVAVSSPLVPNPVAVRYAWAENPVANLFNKEGLPASPFRTDRDVK